MGKYRIVMIGAGNVATHLARALDMHFDVVQVVSRNPLHASALAAQLRNAAAAADISAIVTDADVYLISVSDDSIPDVAAHLSGVTGIVAHTSGSVGIETLQCVGAPHGVLYPLQTFSKDADLDIHEVPFFIEASDSLADTMLTNLARALSQNVMYADSRQRAILHIAAVFGCNFCNHLLYISDNLLKQGGYDLDVLQPILKETMRKAFATSPFAAQTGPAVRGDRSVLDKHLGMLDHDTALLYQTISDNIQSSHNITKP